MAKRKSSRQRDAVCAVPPTKNGPAVYGDGRASLRPLEADFLRALIEATDRCFFLIDSQSYALIYISPAFDRLWGLSRDEFLRDGNRWYETIHPDDVERCRSEAEVRLKLPGASHPTFDYRIFRGDGEQRWIRGNVFECRIGAERFLCGIAEDVTEAKLLDDERAVLQTTLENTVAVRTSELTDANAALRTEIERQERIKHELQSNQAYLKQLLRFQEWDRRLMSMAIHDGGIQNIVAAQLQLDAALAEALTETQRNKLATCRELLQDAVNESRRIINGMRPQTLDDLGLQASLEETAALNERHGLALELIYRVIPNRRTPMVDTTVYRLVQEALNNVRQHAQTDRVRVEFHRGETGLLLTIADDGCGFDPAARPEGFGLRSLRACAAAVGGEVQIESAPGRGTVVTARLPALDPVDAATLDRDRAAAALQAGRLRHQAILDQTEAVVFVKDFAGRYELINRRYEALFRVRREDFIGKTDFDLFPRDVAEKLRSNDRLVLVEGRSITFEESVPSDGEMREYVTVKFPIPGEHGGPPSLCGIATDITDQKQRSRALEETRRRFTAFMDNSPMLAWIKDADGRYAYVNRRVLEVHGFTAEQMLGRTDFEVFPPDVAAVLREHDLEVLRTGKTMRFQEQCPAGDGPALVWESVKFRLQGDDGSYLIGGSALDVSSMRQADAADAWK